MTTATGTARTSTHQADVSRSRPRRAVDRVLRLPDLRHGCDAGAQQPVPVGRDPVVGVLAAFAVRGRAPLAGHCAAIFGHLG
ncbi:hypothetical protein HBB16_13180 [Pseudonocardia sp. MCCB 268]|nr:hypothetical protein [Pseudonocardia cytotoxica]